MPVRCVLVSPTLFFPARLPPSFLFSPLAFFLSQLCVLCVLCGLCVKFFLRLSTFDFQLFQFPFFLQCTACWRASHSWLSRRTVSRKRTASAAMVSSRCSPPCGSLPSFFR